MPSSMQAA